MKEISLLAIFFIFIGSMIISPALAQKEEGLHVKVDHVAGKIEKIKEKITLLLKFNKKAKTDYYQFLAEKRLAELSYVTENNQIDLVEPTASRYATYIGTLTDFVVANNVSEEKEELVDMFDRHAKVVGELQKKFEFESGWWLALQHDINTTKLFQEKIKQL